LPEPIIVVEYDPRWPAIFRSIRRKLATCLGELPVAIEHVGSTSIPNLAAKPVIDIDVVVRTQRDVRTAIRRLSKIGYVHRGDLGVKGREAFYPPAGSPSQHLYVCPEGGRELGRHLVFRDYLRSQPSKAEEYASLKRSLAKKYRNDREGYTEAKSEFVERALVEAERGRR